MFDAETPEGGVTHKREVKETVVVTRVIDKDGEVKEETQVTENKRVLIDGKEVNDVDHKADVNEDKDDDEHDDEKKDEDGEGAPSDSPEPDSPSKSKVKKKKSFKDALKKRFSKRGKDDEEEPKKVE